MSSMLQMPTISQEARSAIRRLYRDWKELEQEKANLTTVTALPTSDMFVWHCNLRPDYGPYAGVIFHLVLHFPQNYPLCPPNVQLHTPLDHPNVFGDWICLDMLKEYYVSTPYVGWTCAYSTLSILLQLQSFLFAENIPQDWGGTYQAHRSSKKMNKTILAALDFEIEIETPDGTKIRHTHNQPWPPLPKYTGELGHIAIKYKPKDRRQAQGTKLVIMTPRRQRRAALQQQSFLYRGEEFPALSRPPTKTGPAAPMASPLENESTTISTEAEGDAKSAPGLPILPAEVIVEVCSFLEPKDLLRVQNMCLHWRNVALTYNLFEKTQARCYFSKVTIDDQEAILGVGLKVQYYDRVQRPDLKAASSPLDLLSLQAFEEDGVRTGVWGGHEESFDHFLPLVLNSKHAAKADPIIEKTVFSIMRTCHIPQTNNHHDKFHPHMIFQLLAALMNTMVVDLMNSSEKGRLHASEKALEGYCAFHHMLLHFAKRYPAIVDLANHQVGLFVTREKARHKRTTPNLGVLLICLTLSRVGWESLRRPLVMEVFDRQVRWNVKAYPSLAKQSLPVDKRLGQSFIAAKTSLRLLMFQVHFMSSIGRPSNTRGPFDVLDLYEKRMGKPTTSQKEDLQRNAKAILKVGTWNEFFQRLGGQVPTQQRIHEILLQAVVNSDRKGYNPTQSRDHHR
jgi:ubiquitin-protein ligase